jgi:putative transposase
MMTFEFKFYNSKQNRYFSRLSGIGGSVWNHLIALHRRYYRLFNKYPNVNHVKKHVTKLKKLHRFNFWNQLGSQAVQDIAERIDRAYKLFFGNLKKGIKTAPPRFRKSKKYGSFTLKQAGWKLMGGNRVKIMGSTREYLKSREIEGNVKTVTVKRDAAGDFWIYFTTDQDFKPGEVRSGNSVGLDFGLKRFLVKSDGTRIESPLFFKQARKEIRKKSKKLSSKKKGGSNREKARLNLARAHRRVSWRGKDFHAKTALELSLAFAIISVEDLNLKGMARLWGGKIHDLGFGDFLRWLDWQCRKRGSRLVKISRFFPSSKTRSARGHVLTSLDLRTREWDCPERGAWHDRDLNAAINIQRAGASALGGEVVRPVPAGSLR